MRKILITGCSGFLSSYLIKEFSGPENKIFGFTKVGDYISGKMDVINADIRDFAAVEKTLKDISPDIIYHLAAISNVGFSWKNPRLTYNVNFLGSSNLLESAARFCPDSRIVLMSSAEVYSKIQSGKLNERSKVSPNNPYALSKLAMEMAADLHIKSKGMDIIKVRSFNFTGPGQDVSFVSPDFASQVAGIEKGKTEPVLRVGNLSARRDFSDVRDIARYLSVLGEKGKTGEIYNTCSGKVFSIGDVLEMLLSLSLSKIKIEVDSDRFRPVDLPLLAGDNTKIKEEFRLTPEFDLRKTLSDLLDHARTKI